MLSSQPQRRNHYFLINFYSLSLSSLSGLLLLRRRRRRGRLRESALVEQPAVEGGARQRPHRHDEPGLPPPPPPPPPPSVPSSTRKAGGAETLARCGKGKRREGGVAIRSIMDCEHSLQVESAGCAGSRRRMGRAEARLSRLRAAGAGEGRESTGAGAACCRRNPHRLLVKGRGARLWGALVVRSRAWPIWKALMPSRT